MTILYRSKVFEDIVNSTLSDFKEEDFISEGLSYDDFVLYYSKFFSLPEESKTAFINKYYKLPFIQNSIRSARKDSIRLNQSDIDNLKKLKDLTLIQESHHTAYPLSWKILAEKEVPDVEAEYRDVVKYSIPSISDKKLTGEEIIDILLHSDLEIHEPFSLVKTLIDHLKDDSPYALSYLEKVFNDCVDVFYYKKEKHLVGNHSFLLKEDAEKKAIQYGESAVPYSTTETDPSTILLHKLLQNVNLNTFNLKDIYILHVRDESHSEDFHYIFESAEEAWEFAVKEVEEMYLKGKSLKEACPDHYREGESFTIELNYGPITYEVVSPLI